ncbi:MAG: cation diffusion facilitator family transporter [Pseudomonadota bacterium]
MADGGSLRIVLIALGASVLIACAKFGAYLWTGSSAILSAAVYSLCAASCQTLLLCGRTRSDGQGDARQRFAYAKEMYFWSFVVAILLFAIGAGVAIYEGVSAVLAPRPIEAALISYIVLGGAAILQGSAMATAYCEARRRDVGAPLFSAVRVLKEPTLFAILLQMAAALAVILVASVGVLIASQLALAEADGAASILIGLILAYVAAFCAIEVGHLLTGQAATPEMRDGIRDIIVSTVGTADGVRRVNEIKTMQLGANAVLVAASVDFEDTRTAADVSAVTQALETAIRTQYPDVEAVFVEVQSRSKQPAIVETGR